jgi:hypothetical protein
MPNKYVLIFNDIFTTPITTSARFALVVMQGLHTLKRKNFSG